MSGTREVDWIYVDDVIDAYLCLAMKEGIEGETIDVGSGELTSVRSVVEHLVKIVGPTAEPNFGGLVDRPLERVRVANFKHAYLLSGWEPKTGLIEGLKQTVDWYQVNLKNSKTEK
jgi:nucleoside-diphosphate-sugar epimerase